MKLVLSCLVLLLAATSVRSFPSCACSIAPCSLSSCPKYPSAKCVPDYCGGCLARYYVNGKLVNCKHEKKEKNSFFTR